MITINKRVLRKSRLTRMTAPTTTLLLETMQSLYNNSKHSDIVLNMNGVQYYLLSPLVEKCAPLLAKEFDNASVKSCDLSPELDADQDVDRNAKQYVNQYVNQYATQLLSLLSTVGKKVVTLTEPKVSNEVVSSVLSFIYGKPLEITETNCMEIYILSIRFGMEYLSTQCITAFEKTLDIDTIIDNYIHAIKSDSPFVKILLDRLVKWINFIPENDLIEAMTKVSYECVRDLITHPNLSDNVDLKYKVAERWSEIDDTHRSFASDLLSHIKLELLSTDLLITSVKNNPCVTTEKYLEVLEHIIQNNSTPRKNKKNSHLFGIGKLNKVYPGYSLVSNTLLVGSDFCDLFRKKYKKTNGIYCLDDLDKGYVCSATHTLQFAPTSPSKPGYLAIEHNMNKGDIYKLFAGHYDSHGVLGHEINYAEIDGIRPSCFGNTTRYDLNGIFVADALTI